MRGGYVHVLTNRENGARYTGVCAGITRSDDAHRTGKGSKFCAEYGIDRLVYVEAHEEIGFAVTRESKSKKATRLED